MVQIEQFLFVGIFIFPLFIKGVLPTQEFIHYEPTSPNIGRFTVLICSELLRGLIDQGSTEILEPTPIFICAFYGKPKIDNSRVTVFVYQNIGWLEVSMDDTFLMGIVNRLADLNEQPEDLFDRQVTFTNVVIQAISVNVLHGEERTVVTDAAVKDRDDA